MKELTLSFKETPIKFCNKNKIFEIKISPLTSLEELKNLIYEKTKYFTELQLFIFNKNILSYQSTKL